MPFAPPRPCSRCHRLVFGATCTACRHEPWQPGAPTARIRGRELIKRRIQLFAEQPFCVACGQTVPTQRDHIVPLADGGLDVDANTQALCDACHKRKTQAEAWASRRW